MIEFELNGRKQKLDVDPNMPLLWAIRDVVGLTGTKFGCGKGLCGACTMHLNCSPIRSCSTPAIAATGSKVTTIEGITEHGPKQVQEAWVSQNVPQCGYCQVGQMMQAAAMLDQNPDPTDEDIDDEMRNICRCGTYPRIRAAIKTASKEMKK